MVVAVGSHDLVHGHRRVFVVRIGPDHKRSPPHWVDGVEHDRMVPYEGHHVVWELLCCLDVRCESSARTLVSETTGFMLQTNVKMLVIDLIAWRSNMVSHKGPYWGLCLFVCFY